MGQTAIIAGLLFGVHMQSSSPTSPPPAPQKRKRPLWLKLVLALAGLMFAGIACAGLVLGYALVVATPNLPSLDALTDYRPKVPLRIYTADHVLIGEFGEERRDVVHIQDVPDSLKKAVLAIEDARFYDHGGVDLTGIARAGFVALTNGHATQGASTITMQVARNFFLSSEKTYTRKIYEMLLAYKIESKLTKDQILEVYMNQIYLGQRAYGFASAARVYFGKDMKDLTLAESAMLAGLPKAPSAYNPVVNPKRAKVRQEYILTRMLELHYITQEQYDAASRQPLAVKGAGKEFSVHAEYVAEMVRQMMYAQFREEAYTRGLNVVTTIDSADQDVAYRSLRKGLMDYERRHGYRGPEAFIDLPADADEREQAIDDALLEHPDNGEIIAAVVTTASPKQVQATLADGNVATLQGDGLRFASSALGPGGFDFNKNKFNHVIQAWRQPGSSFKPFIYSASLEKGLGPATVINDAPLFFTAAETGGQAWEPKNYGGGFDGPMTMRTALQKSKNLVSIRILNQIGPKYAQGYITRFGFDADRHPAYLPMALGAGLVTPLQMAGGFSVFANGGYRINPYLIAEVTDQRGMVVAQAKPLVAGQSAPHAIDARNAYVMNSLLQSVAQRGTGAKTNILKRTDLAGKTGTTNDSRDAWFAGYQHTLTAIAWIGYDNPRSLGDKETGGGLALPVWIDYMAKALKGVPEYKMPMPDGVVTLGDELYFDNFTPGNGFVATVGVSQADLDANSSDAASGAADAPEPEQVGEQEKQDIMNLFRGH